MVPGSWKTAGPINAEFGPPHFLQFIAFLQEPATKAAIEVIVGGILHAAFARFRRLFGGGAEPAKEESKKPENAAGSNDDRTIQLPMKLCPTMWFAHEEVLVMIIADIEKPEDFKSAEPLISEGFRRAGQWIGRHGVTHPFMTYHIRNGVLESKPTLSEHPLDDTAS